MRRTHGRFSMLLATAVSDRAGVEARAAARAWSQWRSHEFRAPVETSRQGLYDARELYSPTSGLPTGGDGYDDTFDARVYAWSRVAVDRDASLVQALHDHATDMALAEWIEGRSLVGVMGGHAVRRGAPEYDDTARLGNRLGASYTVATGGGPGAMEAANLGAYLLDPDALAEALARLTRVPDYLPVWPWVATALEVLAGAPDGRANLGVPTWHYGHEPANVFATAIAKYFKNAVREAILLEICDAGIVFLPGAAGTVQEIFQDACENYYADDESVAPMVLVGREYWTEILPAWPLLTALARDRAMAAHVHLVETVEEAADLLEGRVLGDVASTAT